MRQILEIKEIKGKEAKLKLQEVTSMGKLFKEGK